jgi:hypothetical protein
MDLQVVDGFYILTIDKGILVLTREQFIDGLQRGKWWKRRQASAPRHATMEQPVTNDVEQQIEEGKSS